MEMKFQGIFEKTQIKNLFPYKYIFIFSAYYEKNPCIKFDTLVVNILMEGTLSQIVDVGQS